MESNILGIEFSNIQEIKDTFPSAGLNLNDLGELVICIEVNYDENNNFSGSYHTALQQKIPTNNSYETCINQYELSGGLVETALSAIVADPTYITLYQDKYTVSPGDSFSAKSVQEILVEVQSLSAWPEIEANILLNNLRPIEVAENYGISLYAPAP